MRAVDRFLFPLPFTPADLEAVPFAKSEAVECDTCSGAKCRTTLYTGHNSLRRVSCAVTYLWEELNDAWSRASLVSIVTMLWAGRPTFDSRQWQRRDFFLSVTTPRPTLGSAQPRIQWVPGILSLGWNDRSVTLH
jgi:hypothetical protein